MRSRVTLIPGAGFPFSGAGERSPIKPPVKKTLSRVLTAAPYWFPKPLGSMKNTIMAGTLLVLLTLPKENGGTSMEAMCSRWSHKGSPVTMETCINIF